MDEPRAVVREINGQLVLDDPDALAAIKAVGKSNCEAVFKGNADRIVHFRSRAVALGKAADEVVIIIANVDDFNGRQVADALMPGYDWSQFRDAGQTPYARGLASREFIQIVLEVVDSAAALKLKNRTNLCVVVIDNNTADVY